MDFFIAGLILGVCITGLMTAKDETEEQAMLFFTIVYALVAILLFLQK